MTAAKIFFILFIPAGRAPSGLAGHGGVPLLRWLDGAEVYSTRPPFTRMFPHPACSPAERRAQPRRASSSLTKPLGVPSCYLPF